MPLNYLSGMHIDNVLIRSHVGIPVWFSTLGWLITIVNVIANSVLIFITRKHFLDSTHYWLILSLAIADLLIGVSIFPSIFFCNLSDSIHCDWHMQLFIYSSLIYVSVSSVATTIFGHYIIIAFPLKYATLMASSRIWKIILLSWVIPLVLGLLPLTWENQNSDNVLQITEKYFASLLVLFEIVPFCVFLWISMHLIKIVRTQRNKIQVQCNVHGRLSPQLEHSTVNLENDLNTENSCEETDLSKKVDNVFLVWDGRQEAPNELRVALPKPKGNLSSNAVSKQEERVEQFPVRSNYLYSLNNWLPALPRRFSVDTSLDMSDFTSSFSVSNTKEILHRIRIRQFRDQRRRSSLITCLLIFFMFCYALTFANASCLFSKQCDEFVTSTDFKIVTLFFELLNSALNPILFMLLVKDLRRKVMKLVTCKS